MNKNMTIDETFKIAVTNHSKNNLKEALTLYNKILEINPNHLPSLNNVGVILTDLKEYQKAKACYEKAIEINPNYAEAHSNLGTVFLDLEEYPKAKACYEKAIEINPTYVEAHYNLGNIFKKLKEYQKAKACYEKVIKINPNHIGSHNNLGNILKELKEYQKAKSCFEKVIEINPHNADAHYNLGNIFNELKEHQKAKVCYEKVIEINPHNADAYNNLGTILKTLDQHQEAKACFEKAIEINPSYADAYNNLGLLLIRAGNIKTAKSYFEKAIEINPSYVDAYYNMGISFFELGDNLKAKSFYQKTIKLDPSYMKAHLNLGGLFYKAEQYQEAKACFYKAHEIIPNSVEVHADLACVFISELVSFEKAINSSNKALKLTLASKAINNKISFFCLKHAFEQIKYLNSKNHQIKNIDKLQKISQEILGRKENIQIKDNLDNKILLSSEEMITLQPFFKTNYVYKPKIISGSCINPNKNWLNLEDEYLNSTNQIMYIDDFLSDEALVELREFCLVSNVWHKEYPNKYLGAFSDQGFISPIHLQIAIDLRQRLPRLFGPHNLAKFWGFKYDSTLGKGINIHADFAIHNLNFWITPDEYNNNKNSGGLKVYDLPAPDYWTFKDFNSSSEKIYKYLKENNSNCINIPYKFNRAVLFNSAYFHETDEIDFKDEYEGRRINMTYLFGNRSIKKN
jgi:tetratricopeptide (TPR) repeat protein